MSGALDEIVVGGSGGALIAAKRLQSAAELMLAQRLVGGPGIVASRDRGGTRLQRAASPSGHGIVSGIAGALPSKFKPGCISLKLCRALASIAKSLPARGGPGIGVSQTGNGRLISAIDAGGDDVPPLLDDSAMFKSLDDFVADWNRLVAWVKAIRPLAGEGIRLLRMGDRIAVELAVVEAEIDPEDETEPCGECESCDLACQGCDGTCEYCDGVACEACDSDPCPCDATCDPCDPCQLCDGCDNCDPCQGCDGCDPCQLCDGCDIGCQACDGD